MSDFQIGDVVVCVKDDRCPYHCGCPEYDPTMIGRYFRVHAVLGDGPEDCIGGLCIEGSTIQWCAGTFRKLPKADEQFTQQMRALKPAKVSA